MPRNSIHRAMAPGNLKKTVMVFFFYAHVLPCCQSAAKVLLKCCRCPLFPDTWHVSPAEEPLLLPPFPASPIHLARFHILFVSSRSQRPCFADTGNTFAHFSFPASLICGHREHFCPVFVPSVPVLRTPGTLTDTGNTCPS